MSFFLWIRPISEPRGLGVTDPSGRSIVSFNIRARKRPSDTFEREIVRVLITAGVGQLNTTIFAGDSAILPTKGNFLVVLGEGGTPPNYTQDSLGPAYHNPHAQIRVFGTPYETAYKKARDAYNALAKVTNQTISAA